MKVHARVARRTLTGETIDVSEISVRCRNYAEFFRVCATNYGSCGGSFIDPDADSDGAPSGGYVFVRCNSEEASEHGCVGIYTVIEYL